MKRTKTPARPIAKPAPLPDFRVINPVLEERLDLAASEKNLRDLKAHAGADQFAAIQEILAFANNDEAWQQASNLSAAADQVSAHLGQRYSGLSEKAILKIVNQATYGWR